MRHMRQLSQVSISGGHYLVLGSWSLSMPARTQPYKAPWIQLAGSPPYPARAAGDTIALVSPRAPIAGLCGVDVRSMRSLRSVSRQDMRGIRGLQGLGDTKQIVMTAPEIAGIAVGTAAAMGAGWATAAIPIVGPAIAGVTVGLSLIFNRKGPKQKVATTAIVDQIEPQLKANVDAYLQGPHTVSSQKQAIENFKAGWQYVVEYCDTPEMGNPGKACVSDRQRGGKWDWFSYYLDPIQNDPNVVPDPTIVDIASDSISSIGDSINNLLAPVTGGEGLGTGGALLLLGGLALVAALAS